MKRIAIIPARGGSKRLPGKNVMDFMGKPMIHWTIEAARNSGIFQRIIVSTDDDAIAKISVQAGAEVPFLRSEAADDFAPVSDATIATLKQAEAYYQERYTEVFQLFAVCPLRESKEIRESSDFFGIHKKNFLISCFEYQWMNPWWANTLDENFKPSRIFPDGFKRSQDLPRLYCPTGAIWIANAEALKKEGTFYGNDHIFWPLDWTSSVDIDDAEDVVLAKALYQIKRQRMNS